jgi:enoyl-CoA hydratase
VWTVVLDRATRRNAIDRDTAEALAGAFRAFEADPDARVAVLWGRGGHFCAGADLKSLAELPAAELTAWLESNPEGPLGPTWQRLSKPVIAAVAGYAVAGGLELALWCDLRIAEANARLGVLCRRWGVPLVDGGTVRLPHIIGLGPALDLILTGRLVDAGEALAMGLVTRVVEEGCARVEAEALAAQLAAMPQQCLRNDRASVYDALGRDERDALERERGYGLATLAAGETSTGARAFAAGRGRHGSFE